ncbi:methylated-DNA-[protein]-cysteine S-methyltransferase [Gordonia malaquae]|uniref:Putative methylated-DNA--protein-cysteine methyltransferase n=1 Tax=Gordonia malaquae NBRC 108250 TaxID=1223542 RepID=M3T908_GORML|nr:methylated-DNA--[protein]-cysteine S-methyltransferase [Gordonia malaquae]GAC77911.1 putative methylated-DNA--protein-cysteine methyltransferase [Gordonia malaquae NBRC 108250]SED84451.1 methylated-DNA-[protein]-cysteine S-methyltransferase [Gordonia malaquae]
MTITSQTLGWAGVDTPDGRFTAIFDEDGVVYASGWTDDPAYLHNLVAPSLRGDALEDRDGREVIAAVEAYYAGDLDAPSRIRVRQTSGPFLTAAWAALRQVPAGPPVTYTELAELAGNPAAIRGAASCCARNAAALFVPCHRVVRIGGALGGFRYGLDVKQSLIDREVAAAAA